MNVKTIEIQGVLELAFAYDVVNLLHQSFRQVDTVSVYYAEDPPLAFNVALYAVRVWGESVVNLRVAVAGAHGHVLDLAAPQSPPALSSTTLSSLTIGPSVPSSVIRNLASGVPNLSRLTVFLDEAPLLLQPDARLPSSITYLALHGSVANIRAFLQGALSLRCRLRHLVLSSTDVISVADVLDLVADCPALAFVERLELDDLTYGDAGDMPTARVTSMLETLVVRSPRAVDVDAVIAVAKAVNCPHLELQVVTPRLGFRGGGHSLRHLKETAKRIVGMRMHHIGAHTSAPAAKASGPPPSGVTGIMSQELDALRWANTCGQWSLVDGIHELCILRLPSVADAGVESVSFVTPIQPMTRMCHVIASRINADVGRMGEVMTLAFCAADINTISEWLCDMDVEELKKDVSIQAAMRAHADTNERTLVTAAIRLAQFVSAWAEARGRSFCSLFTRVLKLLLHAHHGADNRFTGILYSLTAFINDTNAKLWPLLIHGIAAVLLPPNDDKSKSYLEAIRCMADLCASDASKRVQTLQARAEELTSLIRENVVVLADATITGKLMRLLQCTEADDVTRSAADLAENVQHFIGYFSVRVGGHVTMM